MTRTDLDEVLDLEKEIFPSAWSRQAFEFECRRPKGVSLIAEGDGRIVGYAIGWAVADELHIANLAVRPDWRRKGIGEALVKTLIRLCPDAEWAGLEVRASNQPAMSLYSRLGFKATAVRKQYYVEEGEDAVVMEKELSEVRRGTHGLV
ncbi:MAG TPA: ribosomal protein S18-alanine N-acetyltransferase [bacterium]